MEERRVYFFAPFRLDLQDERLWREDEVVRLTAKAFAVLRYLVEHAGRLVTKEDLMDAVWTFPAVSEAALSTCLSEIRRALGDSAQAPQFLETVRGRGYRFLGSVTMEAAAAVLQPEATLVPAIFPSFSPAPTVPPFLVGRDAELTQLRQHWQRAQQGNLQVVLVTGEAGIGKTTLVDALVAQVTQTATVCYGRGQCIAHYGAGEAYLPVLTSLGDIGRGPYGAHLVEVLSHYAPTWLLQMPALLPPSGLHDFQRRVGDMTPERMLRELVDAVEVLAADSPVLLVLEDLHYSDLATLEWLAYMAHRRQITRLLVMGTYRPAAALMHNHPVHSVTQDLVLRGAGAEVPLGCLSEASVATYLTQRLQVLPQQEGLAQALYRRTHGHPFFLAALVNEFARQGALSQDDGSWELRARLDAAIASVPETVRQAIEQQIEQCAPEVQAMLEAASVIGVEFPAAAVAEGMAQSTIQVESLCEGLVRQQHLLQAVEVTDWPDWPVTMRYRFRHVLYREVLYARIPVSRRVRWQRQLDACSEARVAGHAHERGRTG